MNVLITGGAGFIGSHIADALLQNSGIGFVRVLDNLSTGFKSNIEHLIANPNFEWMEGDIADPTICKEAMLNIDMVCHQAALGSVPRSIKTPMVTFQNNINGFINILDAARLAGVKKMVYASSSSVYGDANYHPKVEEKIGKVLSPYAASKHTNEIIAERCPDEWNRWLDRDPTVRRGGGESYADAQIRITIALNIIAKRHPGERIAIVMHGGVMRAYLASLLALDLRLIWHFSIMNTAICRVRPFAQAMGGSRPRQGRIDAINDHAHLEGLRLGGLTPRIV